MGNLPELIDLYEAHQDVIDPMASKMNLDTNSMADLLLLVYIAMTLGLIEVDDNNLSNLIVENVKSYVLTGEFGKSDFNRRSSMLDMMGDDDD